MPKGTVNRSGAAAPGDESANLLPAGVMVAAVLAVLVLGAMLRVDLSSAGEPDVSVTSATHTARTGEPGGIGRADTVVPETETASRSAPAPLPPVTAEQLPEDPEARSRADLERLSRHRDGWTLQLMVLCDPGHVRELLAATGDADRLFVLPFDYRGDRCYRVCWGRYRDRAGAARAADLPDSLRARLTGRPAVREIADVAP